jgi:hypothetical protein
VFAATTAEKEHRMKYRKINIELAVFADEADAVVAELNSAIDRLDQAHTIFGGDIETVAVEKCGARRKSALMHTLAAGDAAAAAVKLAGGKIAGACRKVI